MATSNSTNFSIDRDIIITEALELLGVLAEGESPSANQLTSCSRTLNMLAKSWIHDGLRVWLRTVSQVTGLVAGQTNYVLGVGGTNGITTKPFDILKAWRRSTSNVDTMIRVISKDEYNNLPNKLEQGTIIAVYYDRQRTSGNLYTWQTRSSTDTDSLFIEYSRNVEDFDVATDEPDFPQEWYLALSYNLAMALMAKYGTDNDRKEIIMGLAPVYYKMALDGDNELTSFYVSPETSPR